MTLQLWTELFLSTGLFLLGITCAILMLVLFGGGIFRFRGILLDKKTRKTLIEDYKTKRVVLGGMIGLLKIMAIVGTGLLVAGGVLKIASL